MEPTPKAAAPARGIFDESRPLWQVMGFFLVPLVLSNILQSASGTINSIFIGRLIGVDGLAAISTLFPILFLLIGFLIGFSTGSTVLIGQAYGQKDQHKLKLVAGTSITVTFLLGCISAAIGTAFASQMLHVLGTPANILNDAIAYARVIFVMLPLLFVFFAYISFMRGTGDSTTPFIF
ncbi:MAG TPA: MATE family efflux transporter, partial [Candidatus Eremiobacteraceae bacterium]|nr:MATE family efflux transporter [Candidatus Eremiobacteraceae bacterium]